jgi:hypothetical protein
MFPDWLLKRPVMRGWGICYFGRYGPNGDGVLPLGGFILHQAAWHMAIDFDDAWFEAFVNARDASGRTCLHWVVYNHPDARRVEAMIDWLVTNLKATVNVQDRDWISPLMLACKAGSQPGVKCLLELGADVNAFDVRLKTPLMMASVTVSEPGIIVALLERGANPHAADALGRTALMYAATKGRMSCILSLLDHGARVLPGTIDLLPPLADAACHQLLLMHDIVKGFDFIRKICAIRHASITAAMNREAPGSHTSDALSMAFEARLERNLPLPDIEYVTNVANRHHITDFVRGAVALPPPVMTELSLLLGLW